MNQLINCTEIVVTQYVNDHLADEDICRCEECRLDIMAIMLNKLKPHYVVSDAGALFVKTKHYDLQYMADAIVAMAEAVEIVKQKPRH